MRERYAAFGPSQAASACARSKTVAQVLAGSQRFWRKRPTVEPSAEITPKRAGVMTRRSPRHFDQRTVGDRFRAPEPRADAVLAGMRHLVRGNGGDAGGPRSGIRRELHGRADQPRCAGRMPDRRSEDAAWVFQHPAEPDRTARRWSPRTSRRRKTSISTRRSSRRSPREPSSLFRDRPCRPIFCSARSRETRITFTIQRGCRPHL